MEAKIQGTSIRLFPIWVNFVPAVAYHFCLNLPPAFLQPGNGLVVQPCTHIPTCKVLCSKGAILAPISTLAYGPISLLKPVLHATPNCLQEKTATRYKWPHSPFSRPLLVFLPLHRFSEREKSPGNLTTSDNTNLFDLM